MWLVLKRESLWKIFVRLAVFLVFARPGLAAAELRLSASMPALPVMTGVTQGVEIELAGDAPDGSFDVEVEAGSGWGVLMFSSGPSGRGTAKISRGAPLCLDYRWSGASPVSAPAAETITAKIPALGLSGELSFQVGVDVRVREISLPGAVRAGAFNPVEIVVEDAFNPSLDIAELIAKTGGAIEISMSLAGGPRPAPASGGDPVVGAFFGETGGGGEASYPGGTFAAGSLARDGGRFVWRGGMSSGVTPPAPGEYVIEAILKANLGGVPLKHWTSPSFEVSGNAERPVTHPLARSALDIIARLDAGVFADATDEVARRFGEGDAPGALSSLGAHLSRAFGHDPAPSLGKFAAALGASGKGEDEIVNFLVAVMRGFGGCGVLVFTRNGLTDWSASGEALDNGRYVSVPFSSRRNITVRMTGASADVSLWKIIPSGVNAKKYPKGSWIKEITVHTSEVTPPRN
jgi:hypothetical protein